MFNTKNNPNIAISNQEFDQLKKWSLLIDVRDPNEYQVLKKIRNEDNTLNIINVPYYELINNPQKYISTKDITIITICNAGNRSTAAAISLREQGYSNVYVLKNGVYGYYYA